MSGWVWVSIQALGLVLCGWGLALWVTWLRRERRRDPAATRDRAYNWPIRDPDAIRRLPRARPWLYAVGVVLVLVGIFGRFLT